MQNSRQGDSAQILPLLLQTTVAVAVLLGIWFLIMNLPMLDEIYLPLPFTLVELLSAILVTVIVVVTINFGSKLERALKYKMTRFPQLGMMLKLLLVIGSVLLLYFFYEPLIIPFIDDLDWIYHGFFLFILIGLIGIFGYSIYQGLGGLTQKLADPGSFQRPARPGLTCPACGLVSASDMSYCGSCGTGLTGSKASDSCGNCGMGLKAGISFCPECGSPVEEVLEAPPSEPEMFNCGACGRRLKPDAVFCPDCGAPA